jgi:hypothetical protein
MPGVLVSLLNSMYSPKRWTGLKRTRLSAPWSKSQFLRRALSLASFALLRRQQITINASNGNPRIHDTIGIIMLSGVTERRKRDLDTRSRRNFVISAISLLSLLRAIDDFLVIITHAKYSFPSKLFEELLYCGIAKTFDRPYRSFYVKFVSHAFV